MIRDRLISLFNKERTTVWFEDQTGIGRYRWQNIKSGKARLTEAEIEAVMELFPGYRWWLMTGEVMPEAGQTSPEYDEANKNLKEQGQG
ncbi:MAG: DNA-binding protein [Alcanivorax sp.]|nr:MAG: DNA-binding protein [Alcanivorax sp.]